MRSGLVIRLIKGNYANVKRNKKKKKPAGEYRISVGCSAVTNRHWGIHLRLTLTLTDIVALDIQLIL